MSRPAIQSVDLTPNLALSEFPPDSECRTNSWWLYDRRVGWNIGMRKSTRDGAIADAIEYWARRALKAESAHSQLQSKVGAFVNQFLEPEDVNQD